MKIGLDVYTIEHRGLGVEETFAFAEEHGIEGIQFLDPSRIAPDLDPARLVEVRDLARRRGLTLEVGLSSPNPARRSRIEGRSVDPADLARELTQSIKAIAILGCPHARVYLGDRHDRFRTDSAWSDHLQASRDVLRRLCPALRDHGVALAVETHADLTADELLRLLDEFEPETVGVTLDTGNLPMRLDDPLAAVERLAPRVLSTHIKDAVLALTPRGLCWQARPIGSGILPMPDLLAILHRANPALMLSIELHPRTYDLPIFDPSWLAHFPDLRPDALAAVVRLAAACERRYAEGSLARPEVVESIPWADRDLDWIASSLGYLRAILALFDRVEPPREGPGTRIT